MKAWTIAALVVSLSLLASQLLFPIVTLKSDNARNKLNLPSDISLIGGSNTTSGIEILLGGDYASHDVSVWENVNQTWQKECSFDVYFPGWGMIFDIEVADIDGDTEMETIVANSGSKIHIYEYVEGQMVLSHNLTHPLWDDCQVVTIAVGDLDNDGSPYLEILAGTFDFNVQSVVFKRNGDSYSPALNISSSDPRNIGGPACCVGDIDNNDDLEFIVTEEFPDPEGVSLLRLFDWQTDHWANIRNYTFTTGDIHNMVRQVQIEDVDNDGQNEVLVNQDQDFVLVLEYAGGVFVESWRCPLLTSRVFSTLAGDITNDGKIDIVIPDRLNGLIYIYETVETNIINTFNITLGHGDQTAYTCIDIADLDGDSQNEWAFVYYNVTAFPHPWITVFKNDTILQQCQTGYLYAATVEIGNYDSDEARTITTSTSTTSTNDTTPPFTPEVVLLLVAVPIALVAVAFAFKRLRR